MRIPEKPSMAIALLAALIIAAPAAALAYIIPGFFINPSAGQFTVKTAQGESYDRELEKKADQFTGELVDFFSSRIKSAGVSMKVEMSDKKYHIYFMRDKEEFNKFWGETHFDQLDYNDGYFDPKTGNIALIHASGEDFQNDFAALRHELTHLVMNEAFPNKSAAAWSPWLSEGLAYYFESEDDLNAALIKAVKASSIRFIPLEELLEADGKRFMGSDNKYYYDESLALTAFLIKKYPAEFNKYFRIEAESGRVGVLDFSAVFGKSVAEIESELKAWLLEYR